MQIIKYIESKVDYRRKYVSVNILDIHIHYTIYIYIGGC